MPVTRSRKRSSARRLEVLQKPRGVIHPRVQKVGPEQFWHCQRRLCQSPLQVDAVRLLWQCFGSAHRRRA